VAAVFNDNGSGVKGDLKAVVRTILLDSEARADAGLTDPAFGKLREPLLRFIQWARSFGLTSADDSWNIGDLSDPATRLGQSPLRAPSVFNFFRPGYVPPNSPLGDRSLAAPEFQITTESSVAGYVNFMQKNIASGIAGMKADYAAIAPFVDDSAALLAELNVLLAAGQLSAPTLASPLKASNAPSGCAELAQPWPKVPLVPHGHCRPVPSAVQTVSTMLLQPCHRAPITS